MTDEMDGIKTLSRSSDHLGNLANILKDLGGGATLLNELTQNANDAGADAVRFTATKDELQVWNSGVFTDCGHDDLRKCPWKTEEGRRSCDLHSFREVAGRHKADDSATTGAFGVGFTAVYQVTDHPELITGRRHLTLDESQSEDDRIRICPGGCSRDHDLQGTSLFLPWARFNTELRRALGAMALAEHNIEDLVQQMHEAGPAALVFLENLASLEVRSTSATTTVRRERVGDRIIITANDHESQWLVLEGDADGAEELKAHYDHTESDRSGRVLVAVPLAGTAVGRIFADLPTETRTGWSGHINGTFFPRQDRKTVEFGGQGFRGKWNDLLIETAARVVANSLETIAIELGDPAAWAYLVAAEQINRDVAKEEYPSIFSKLFEHAKAAAPEAEIAPLISGERVRPSGVLVPVNEAEYEASGAMVRLDMPVLHSSIRNFARQITRTQYGMSDLSVADVVDAVRAAGLTQAWSPSSESLLDGDDAKALLLLLEQLQGRGKSVLESARADEIAIAPCVDGSYAPAQEVSLLDENDRALFELLDPQLKILDRDRLRSLCPSLIELCDDITPNRAIEIFESDPDALAVAPDQVLEWLDDHRGALASDEVKARVRALPIFPSTRGELRPLDELSLASDFDDVLGVADVVDRDKTEGHGDLLRMLGARELDAVEYLSRHILPVARSGELSDEQAASVLAIVSQHRPELEGETSTHSALASVPLIATDHGLQPATRVHLPNRALTLIDPDAPVARVDGMPSHVMDTLLWLGVSQRPNNSVLAAAATRLAEQESPPDNEAVLAILDSLPSQPSEPEVPGSLRALTTSSWLPVEGGHKARPRDVYAGYQKYLFESQGPHLGLPLPDQNRLSEVLRWLGVQRAPTTAMVIAHLRYSVKAGTMVNNQVFRFLGEAKEEALVRTLRDEPCVQVAPAEYVKPDFVFWTDPELGRWVTHLPGSHREYQTFYERVGVQDTPSAEQIEQILRQISRTSGNNRLDDDDQAVVHRCWEILDQQLPVSVKALERLRAVKSALGPRSLLERPELLLFVDGRRLAEKILLIRDNLIHRARTTHRALTQAGVRAAEDVITAHVDGALASDIATDLTALIRDRLPALERLIEAQRSEDFGYDLDALSDLRIDVMPELAVEYVTRFAHQVQVDDPIPAEAIYVREEHRLIVRSQTPSRHLARELALCISPQADVSKTAPSMLEILRARNLAAAMEVLDEYGVQDLDQTSWASIQSSEAADLDGPDDSSLPSSNAVGQAQASTMDRDASGPGDVPATTDDVARDSGESSKEPVESESGDGHGRADSGSTSNRKRSRPRPTPNTSRLTSYVLFGESTRDSDVSDAAEKNSAIDRAGVDHVLAYETSCGRVPEQQTQTNPGFDVLSRNSEGAVVRRIEIKSIGGPWTDRGVLLSSTQFDDARANPDTFWLYVVEHAEDDDAYVIHRIQNPAGQVTKYAFDGGWQALDEPEIPRDGTGRPDVSTRSLLGWGTKADTV